MDLNWKRRPYRFSVAVLSGVVGIAALWAGWNLYQVRERKAARQWIEQQGGFADTWSPISLQKRDSLPEPWRTKAAQFPRVRLWFGDEAVYNINLACASFTWADRQRIDRLFPEAFVMPERPDGFYRPGVETEPEQE